LFFVSERNKRVKKQSNFFFFLLFPFISFQHQFVIFISWFSFLGFHFLVFIFGFHFLVLIFWFTFFDFFLIFFLFPSNINL